LPGNVRGRGALRDFLNFAVRQCNLNRIHAVISPGNEKDQAYRRGRRRSR
jgi:hypothetical protein